MLFCSLFSFEYITFCFLMFHVLTKYNTKCTYYYNSRLLANHTKYYNVQVESFKSLRFWKRQCFIYPHLHPPHPQLRCIYNFIIDMEIAHLVKLIIVIIIFPISVTLTPKINAPPNISSNTHLSVIYTS